MGGALLRDWFTVRRPAIVVALGLALTGASACTKEAPAPGGRLAAAIADVEAGRRPTPLIGVPAVDGSTTVTFLAKADAGRAPRVVSDVTGWGESVDGNFDIGAGAMRPIAGTKWFSLEARVAPAARIEYLIAYGQADYRRDPHNPRGHAGGLPLGGAPASEFVTPGYRPPPELVDPPASPAGALSEHTVQSRALGRPCVLTVYTPPGYRPEERYPLAVFVDVGPRDMPRVIDWAITHRAVEPFVAVFALPDSVNRGQPSPAEMEAFLSVELPGWLGPRYRVATDGRRRALLAISFGARDALDAALAAPNAYARLGLLIPGRRIGPKDIEDIGRRSRARLRVAILAGLYDRSNLPTARSVRQALVAAGHDVDYLEVPEGHSPVTFHHHLCAVLAALFPPP
jgi:enterochelin esterase-like enzyme